jgi:hypothetical protein
LQSSLKSKVENLTCNFLCKVLTDEEVSPPAIEMSEQNPSLFLSLGGVGEFVPSEAEHAFVGEGAAGSSNLAAPPTNLQVDLKKSAKKSESDDSEGDLESISLGGRSFDFSSDITDFSRQESKIRRALFNKASLNFLLKKRNMS